VVIYLHQRKRDWRRHRLTR